jgi:hypothetical protein
MNPLELIDFFKNEPMDFAPGTEYRYSNSGYIVLGYIIEQVSGMSYGEYVDENFFRPLGMANSYYDNSSMIIPNRIPGYKKHGEAYENADFLSMTLPYAGGSLLSNLDDLFKWYQAVSEFKILSKESMEKAHSPYRLVDGRVVGYGYGWRLGNIQESQSISHGGLVNGFTTYAVYLPAEDILVIVFSNCECTQTLDITTSMMAAIVLEQPYQWEVVELSISELEDFQGLYNSTNNGTKKISVEDNRLLYFDPGGSKSLLRPLGKDRLHLENSLTTLEFQRDSRGEVVSFDLTGVELPIIWSRRLQDVQSIKSIKLTNKILNRYRGKYQFSSDFIFEVVREEEKMYGQVGKDRQEILPYETNKFFAKDLDATLLFEMGENNDVIGLTIIQGDGEKHGEKIESFE